MSCRHPSIVLMPLLCAVVGLLPAADTTITVEQVTLPTYPFSDPSPLIPPARLHPYHRFDGFSHVAEKRAWTLVKLDNPWLTVWVAPEIGGKVWGAVEKSSGRAFIYRNPVVKFRDVALRGPWTSGGIEFNVGIIGHSPTTATPVDWATRTLPDGTAECLVGALDLPSRTEWRVAIRLPPDRAAFSTDGWWHNPTTGMQACYQWTTAAAGALDDLRVLHPGSSYLGHGGDVHPWPVENGHDLSRYADNRHQPDSSYHVVGAWAEYFGGWYDGLDLGYAHWSPTGDKPGQKVWLWSQAPSGAIWRDLLTDAPAGQYIEMQSGLMHSQADANSTRTPFKHAGLAPGATLTWQEQWFPMRGVAGLVDASPWGALNVTRAADTLEIRLCPVQAFSDDLVVRVAGAEVARRPVRAEVMKPLSERVDLAGRSGVVEVAFGGRLAWRSDDGERRKLDRPLTAPADYAWDSAEGYFLAGEEHLRQRAHVEAIASFTACLAKEQHHLRALVRLADLRHRRGEPAEAMTFARHALSIDATDAEANLVYAAINDVDGRRADAIDGYGWAARSPALRGIANTRLAAMHARDGDWWRADLFAQRALTDDARSGGRLCAFIARQRGDRAAAGAALDRLLETDPLDHLARAERWRLDPTEASRQALITNIRNELPVETWLELASWYADLGASADAVAVLRLAPAHPLVDLHLAWLQRDDAAVSDALLARFVAAPVRGLLPFRLETLRALTWTQQRRPSWKSTYLTGVVLAGLGREADARALLDTCGDTPDEAVFFLNRGRLRKGAEAITDFRRAQTLDPQEWRAPHLLAQTLHEQGDDAGALAVTTPARTRFPANQALILAHANACIANGRPAEALALLEGVTLLPFEGATDGRDVYHRAHLCLTIVALADVKIDEAERHLAAARSWPELLGAGRPVQTDERIEDYLAARLALAHGDQAAATTAFRRVVEASRQSGTGAVSVLAILAARALRADDDAATLAKRWEEQSGRKTVWRWGSAWLAGDRAAATSALDNDEGRRLRCWWRHARHDGGVPPVAMILERLER